MTQALAVKPFEQTKLYDFTMSLPLQAFYGWGVWTLAQDIANRYRELMSGASPLGWIGLSSQVLTLLFLSLLTFLLIIRRVPKAKSAGFMSCFCAIMGMVASITYSQIPLADLPIPLAPRIPSINALLEDLEMLRVRHCVYLLYASSASDKARYVNFYSYIRRRRALTCLPWLALWAIDRY